MNTQVKVILTILISLSLVQIVLVVSNKSSGGILGSISDSSSAYVSTSTKDVSGTTLTSPTVLCNGYGTLGSVIVTGANTGIINLYDGTSTVQHSDYATRTLATLPASLAAGTYTYDLSFTRGLVIESSGLTPTTTITCKK